MEKIMKKFRNSLLGTSMLLLMANPAFAVDTTRTYNSGLLVGLFLAFCALVVVAQVMPTIVLLISFVKQAIKGTDKQVARQRSRR